MSAAVAAQLGVHPGRAMAAPGLLMDGLELAGELGVLPLPLPRAGQVGTEGGVGDLQ